MDKTKIFYDGIRELSPNKEYFVYLSAGFSNSQPIPQLLEGFEPIFICGELPGKVPDNFMYLAGEILGRRKRGRDLSYEEFYQAIVNSERIQKLFQSLVREQGHLDIKTFRNHPSFASQFEDPRMRSFGLTPEQAETYNSKVNQYRLFNGQLSLPRYVATTAEEAGSHFETVASSKGVFVNQDVGGGGHRSHLSNSKEELEVYLATLDPTTKLILAESLDLAFTPSIDIIIANPDEVIAYGIMDQIFDKKNPLGCRGNVYPSSVPEDLMEEVVKQALVAGRVLAEQGVKGYVSLDFNIDSKERVLFGEINARYAGSSAERMLLMEQTRPERYPTILDLERMAIFDGTFNGFKLWEEPQGIFVLRRELYAQCSGRINHPQILIPDETDLFQRKQGSFVGMVEDGSEVKKGEALGKFVAVAESAKERDRQVQELEGIVDSLVI